MINPRRGRLRLPTGISLLDRALAIILAITLAIISAVIPINSNAAFPGINGQIAFDSGGIAMMQADGTGHDRLAPYGEAPAWSADGSRLAFVRWRDGAGADLYGMHADGSDVRRVVENGRYPAWSPDGTQLVFSRSEPSADTVYRVDAAGGEPVALAQDGYAPDWSPDGTQIVLVSRQGGIDRVAADGSGRVNLAAAGYDPDWSPDGRRIAYTCLVSVPQAGGTVSLFQVCVMNADGSSQRNVTNSDTQDRNPAWSPDGSKIAFSRFTGMCQDIFVMDADGGSQVQLTEACGYNPDWQPLPSAAPVCARAEPSQSLLWPASHAFVAIDILGVTDPDGDAVAITIDSIFQDEPVDAPGSGNTSPDGRGVGTSTAQLRAERMGAGDGRVYHVGFTADDGRDRSCTGEVWVGVPKSRGFGAVDGGALYDSTGVPVDATRKVDPAGSVEDEVPEVYLPDIRS